MSDLLIKNIELPEKWSRLRLSILPDGSVCRVEPFNEALVPTDAKAEILEEHGDLIDKDNLMEYISDTFCKPCKRSKPIVCRACDFGDVMDIIEEETPVVLPKSGS